MGPPKKIAESHGKRAKHADRQHGASQRCIFIARQHKLMKRSSTPFRPMRVRPATHPERWASPESAARRKATAGLQKSILRQVAFLEAKSALPANGTRPAHTFRARQARRSRTSVADGHSTSNEEDHFSTLRRGRQRTNGWSERKRRTKERI